MYTRYVHMWIITTTDSNNSACVGDWICVDLPPCSDPNFDLVFEIQNIITL